MGMVSMPICLRKGSCHQLNQTAHKDGPGHGHDGRVKVVGEKQRNTMKLRFRKVGVKAGIENLPQLLRMLPVIDDSEMKKI
jgi:hypothetical protein